jgi:hypothetical protein
MSAPKMLSASLITGLADGHRIHLHTAVPEQTVATAIKTSVAADGIMLLVEQLRRDNLEILSRYISSTTIASPHRVRGIILHNESTRDP